MIERLSIEGLSGSTVRGVVTATSAMFRYGVQQGVIERNPCRDLERGDRPSGKRLTEPRYIDADQIGALLDRLGPEFRPIAATCAYAALRISEALALKWEHVDLVGGILNVPGTKTEASGANVPMIPLLVDELRAHCDRQAQVGFELIRPGALVFQTASGKAQDRRNTLRALYAAGDVAGLNGVGREPVGLHDLRHSCAGLLLAAGTPMPKVAAILRHSNPRITADVYAGLVESQREGLREDLAAAFTVR
jgi:integrase